MDQSFQDLLLQNLTELKAGQDKINDNITELKVDQATMKTEYKRDGRWISGIGAAIGVGLSSGIHFIFKK